METLFYNGRIATMAREIPWASALLVKSGIIIAIGHNDDILPMARSETRLVNLYGCLTTPGFCDSHIHLLSCGWRQEKAALGVCRSLTELVETGRVFAASHPTAEWILGSGWNNDSWPVPVLPSRTELDAVSIPPCGLYPSL